MRKEKAHLKGQVLYIVVYLFIVVEGYQSDVTVLSQWTVASK